LWFLLRVPQKDEPGGPQANIYVELPLMRRRMELYYSGTVQGVGFRYTVKALTRGFEVVGTVRNLPEGGVELIAEGAQGELEEFRKAIQDSEVGRFIRNEDVRWGEARNEFRGFEIIH
jgi:acylphosphatase